MGIPPTPSVDAVAIINAIDTSTMQIVGALNQLERSVHKQFLAHDHDLRAVVERVTRQFSELLSTIDRLTGEPDNAKRRSEESRDHNREFEDDKLPTSGTHVDDAAI